MAFYDKLLLSKGGGIIPMQHMIEQIPNTATLLIGLGGTGIDCISLIKEKVQQMIMPDDPLNAAPSHSHIRFLGIDTDNAHVGLDNSEYFSVACNTSIKARFSNQHININRLQHIHHFKFTNAELFFRKLYEAEGINVCHKK